jgi:cysteine synthase A
LISSPGTGGTTATLGRYVRYRQHCTRVLCADAERSVFFDFYQSGDASLRLDCGSRIEGIGRPRGGVVSAQGDRCDGQVPDALSLAAMHYLAERLGGMSAVQRHQPDRRADGGAADESGGGVGVDRGDFV